MIHDPNLIRRSIHAHALVRCRPRRLCREIERPCPRPPTPDTPRGLQLHIRQCGVEGLFLRDREGAEGAVPLPRHAETESRKQSCQTCCYLLCFSKFLS